MSLSPTIIAVCGLKQSGKDTVAKYICKNYSYVHKKIAEPLKTMCQYLFDMTNDQLEDHKLKETVDDRWGVTPRQIMQFMGTEVMQFKLSELLPHLDRTFWIQKFINSMRDVKEHNIVISDLRFVHEHEQLKHAYGKSVFVIMVERPLSNDIKDMHSSEQELKQLKPDFTITNDSSLEELYKKVDVIIKSM